MKTKEEILNQTYVTASDMKILFPTIGRNKCNQYIKEMRKEMLDKGYFVPDSVPLLAHIKIFKKKFNL